MEILFLILVFWSSCGVFVYGANYAQCRYEATHKYYSLNITPREDAATSFAYALAGPFAVPESLICTGFLEHGWRLK